MWQELYPKSRKRLAPRFDKNVRKGQRGDDDDDKENQAPTEKQWKRQRRADMDRQLAQASSEPLQEVDLTDVWTDKHTEESMLWGTSHVFRVS